MEEKPSNTIITVGGMTLLDSIHTLHNGPRLCEPPGVLSLCLSLSAAAFSNKEGCFPTTYPLVLLFWKIWLKPHLTTG